MRNSRYPIIALLLLFAFFAAGMVSLLMLRLKTGDLYPACSSLRADPLGVEAFYEALQMMPGVSVQRNYRSLSHLEKAFPHGRLTLFYLGLDEDFLTGPRTGVPARLESLAKDGARIVLCFRPVSRSAWGMHSGNRQPLKTKKEIKKARTKDGSGSHPSQSAGQEWEVSAVFSPEPADGAPDRFIGSLKEKVEGLPPTIPLNTLLYFRTGGDSWRILYSAQERPVLLERSFGAGSIVFLADTYLLSNEAMLKSRFSGLLSWLVGSSRVVVFDEYHLGLRENPGIVSMARKYRLDYLFFGLIVLAGLFLWRNAVPFVPAERSEEESVYVLEMDQTEGLIGLLQRNIKADMLLGTCLEQYEKSAGQNRAGLREKILEARGKLEGSRAKGAHHHPVETYKEIARILSHAGLR